MMTYVECITPIVKLNLKLQCRSSLCDYSDAYILVSGAIVITGAGGVMQQNEQMKEIKEYYTKIVPH